MFAELPARVVIENLLVVGVVLVDPFVTVTVVTKGVVCRLVLQGASAKKERKRRNRNTIIVMNVLIRINLHELNEVREDRAYMRFNHHSYIEDI